MHPTAPHAVTELAPAVRRVLDWPVDHVAATVVSADGDVLADAGDTAREFPLASVTKLLSAYAVLVAVEEGAVDCFDAWLAERTAGEVEALDTGPRDLYLP